jgi:multiple sugar transport system permease protein
MPETVATRRKPGSRRAALAAIGFWTLLIITMLWTLTPILWMATTAFKKPIEYVSDSPSFLPSEITFEHFFSVVGQGFFQQLGNSLTVAAGATLLAVMVGFAAAYALARLQFPARLDIVFLVILLMVKLMPPIVVALPLLRLLRELDLLNNHFGLVLVYQLYALPYSIWMLLGFMRDIPPEVEEAAMIDNAGLWRRLRDIILPLAAPGITATLIFTFILTWNEYLFALLYLDYPSQFTLPLRIANYITEDGVEWGELMAIGLLASLPALILSVFVQRHLVQGLGGR